jgi:hypothetical protein
LVSSVSNELTAWSYPVLQPPGLPT